jgi:hypothetical protein
MSPIKSMKTLAFMAGDTPGEKCKSRRCPSPLSGENSDLDVMACPCHRNHMIYIYQLVKGGKGGVTTLSLGVTLELKSLMNLVRGLTGYQRIRLTRFQHSLS